MENRTSPKWSRFHLAAAALMAFTFLVHTFVGGPEIYAPVRASDFDPALRSVLSVVWHIVTIMLAVMAVGVFVTAISRNAALEWVLIALNLGTAALFIGYGLADLGNVIEMPQWTGFLLIAVLMLIGQMRR